MPAIIAVAIVLSAHAGILSAQEPASNARAAVMEKFARRVDAYVTLHRRLEEPLPPMTREAGSWSMFLAKRYLASAIRTARSKAMQGDIFDPDAATMFRELIAEAPSDPDLEALVRELYTPSLRAPAFDLTVNEPYSGVTRETPSIILKRLPALPEHVEYRIVGHDLVLWDVHADIVVDYVPNAFASSE
jgi:hypothetical protein